MKIATFNLSFSVDFYGMFIKIYSQICTIILQILTNQYALDSRKSNNGNINKQYLYGVRSQIALHFFD